MPRKYRKRKRKIFDIGQRFGMGVIIADMKLRAKNGQWLWMLQCDCGNKYKSLTGALNAGKSKSCGCKARMTGKNARRWCGCGDIPLQFFNACKNTAKPRLTAWGTVRESARSKKTKEFSVTIEDMKNQWEKQKGKCVYTGINLTFGFARKKPKHPDHKKRTASLDRIDSSKGYVPENIEFCHKHINLMKQSFEKEHFIKMCKLVAGGV